MPDEPSPEIKTLAMAAGLSLALTEFPADVAAAAASAAAATKALKLPADPLAEPWPPMQVGYVP
jgi:hypothetical protein